MPSFEGITAQTSGCCQPSWQGWQAFPPKLASQVVQDKEDRESDKDTDTDRGQ